MLTCRVSGIFLVLIVQSQISFAQKAAVEKTSGAVASGFERFNDSCAFCLGIDARGNGAAAGLLSTQPAGLTQLSKRNR